MNRIPKSTVQFCFSVFSISILCGLNPASAAAQQKNSMQTVNETQNETNTMPEATTAAYGDWVLRCQKTDPKQNATVCEVGHSVVVEGQNGPVLQLAIGKAPKGQAKKLVVILPANVALTQVPQVEVATTPPDRKAASWLRCLPVACFADIDLESLNWKTAQAGKVSYVDAGNRPLSVPFSLKGLDRALAALGD